jgi:hypothetical protein
MDVSSAASTAMSAATAPFDAGAAIFRKAVEIPAEGSMQIIKMMADQAGLGTKVDTTA